VGLPGMYNQSGVIDTSKLIKLKGACLIKNDTYTGRDGVERQSSKIASYLCKLSQTADDVIPF